MSHTSTDDTGHRLPRVLLVNKFYYPRGGDCVVLLNTEQLLRQRGHEVAVFAMRFDQNLPSPQQDYFAAEVDFGAGIGAKLRAAARSLGLGDIQRDFGRMLADFRPDVVHLHNIHSYLSPVVATMARRAGVRVVWTLHDYKLLCPSYACLRDGHPCEQCVGGSKAGVLRNRCMKGSLAASVMAWVEALRWNRDTLQRATDCFICPSQFMANKMAQGGFEKDKLRVITNFSTLPPHSVETERSNYYCYVGRLSAEKGVATLLRVVNRLPYELRVAGDGPMLDELRRRYADNPNITFLGRLNAEGVHQLLANARLSVMPSEWYENNPLSVIESLLVGTPVVGSDAGGIPELLAPAERGIIFGSGDETALEAALRTAYAREWPYEVIAADAAQQFSPDRHYDALMAAYGKV